MSRTIEKSSCSHVVRMRPLHVGRIFGKKSEKRQQTIIPFEIEVRRACDACALELVGAGCTQTWAHEGVYAGGVGEANKSTTAADPSRAPVRVAVAVVVVFEVEKGGAGTVGFMVTRWNGVEVDEMEDKVKNEEVAMAGVLGVGCANDCEVRLGAG